MNCPATPAPDFKRSTTYVPNELRRGWRALVLGFIGVSMVPLSVFLYILGPLTQPLQAEFGWSRADLQLTLSFVCAGYIVATQIVGWMNRRWGMRNVTACSLVCLSLVWVCIPIMSRSIVSFYLLGFALPIFGLGATHITWSNLTILWFERNRGLALSAILCGSGLVATVFPYAVTWICGHWGWRSVFWSMAILPVTVVLPMTLFWLKKPDQVDEEGVAVAAPNGLVGLTYAKALRSPRFWLFNTAISVSIGCVIALVSIAVPLLRDKGFSAEEASKIFGIYGISLILGRITVGFLIDRIWAPAIAAVVLAMPAITCAMISVGDPSTRIPFVFAMIFLGIGSGAELDVGAYLASRYFGTRNYGRIYGFHLGTTTVASMLAPFFFSRLYALTGSYVSTLLTCAIAFIASSMMLLMLGRYPRYSSICE
ncbi:MFS transporter [Paraburkholderia sediminicola]|uniref:MFS transporter n=1 Tax=Paraburkholderia sediminicola TaxID=458836 RepID=UPI000E71AA4D